jgi:UDP-3-O-[3-hydroxymyristoyl] glucosamine N-acyltransferase
MSTILLGTLAAELGCELAGDPEIEIHGVSTLEKAQTGEISFLANLKYAPKAKQSRASAIFASERLISTTAATLISSNPYYDFARALEYFHRPCRPPLGIHPTAVIANSAKIGPNPSIGAYVVIGENVHIGANATIHPHAVIYEGCQIGDDLVIHAHVSIREFCTIGNRVTLHNGVVIGGDGFGFAKKADGTQFKIVQTGRTVLEDDVEVQTLTSVDRATMGETRVKRGAKIDSLVQIGHACVVGEDNIICAQTGLAGSTVLEAGVIMAGQSGSAGHLTIHKGATVYAQAGVGHDVPENTTVGGSPAFEVRDWLRACTAFTKLPEIWKTLRQLERRVQELDSSKVGS